MNNEAAPSRGGKGRALAVVLLVVGLVVGLGAGYLAAPRSAPSAPENVLETTGSSVQLAVTAGHTGTMLGFWIGGLQNPTVSVQRGANVTIYMENTDPDMPHSLVVVAGSPPFGMDPPEVAFPGAETPMAMNGTMPMESDNAAFTASTAGTYYYVCHVPGHASGGMYGTFVVRA